MNQTTAYFIFGMVVSFSAQWVWILAWQSRKRRNSPNRNYNSYIINHQNTAPNSSENRPRIFTEGYKQRGNGNGGPSTEKPLIKPQPQGGRRDKIELQDEWLRLHLERVELQNKQIFLLLQSMKHEWEERPTLAISQMESQPQKINETPKPEEISDGYHTLSELYEHRHALCLALMRSIPDYWWISRRHSDGELCFGSDEWFIVGADLPGGNSITYHLPSTLWDLAIATGATILERGRSWDGHTPQDVVERLKNYALLSQ